MNYRQTSVTGESWVRATRIVIENPRKGVPAATFIEEQVVNVGDDEVARPVGNVSEPFIVSGEEANLMESFDLLHPETGEVVGSATYLDIHVMLHSLYYHVAAKRDAGPAPASPEE